MKTLGLLLALSAMAHGQAPASAITLDVPATCEIGELVRLDATGSDVDALTWQIIPDTPDFEVVDGGKRAFFSSRQPGEYRVIIAGAKGGVPSLLTRVIEVTGTAKPLSLKQVVTKAVKSVADYPGKDEKQKALGQVFRRLASDNLDVDKILEATALANSAVLGADLDKWVPFLDAIGDELDAMILDGRLGDRASYSAAWLTIAEVLGV